MTDVKLEIHNESVMEMHEESYKGTEERQGVINSSGMEGLVRVRLRFNLHN